MDVVIWTLVFLGGSVLLVAFLLFWALKKDREKQRLASTADDED